MNTHIIKPKPNPEVIKILEEALIKAESGMMQEIVLIGFSGHSFIHWQHVNKFHAAFIGLLETIKHYLVRDYGEIKGFE